MPDTFDTLAQDTVTAARVPAARAAPETADLARAMRSLAAESRANGLDGAEVMEEVRAVASVSRGALALRYATEALAP